MLPSKFISKLVRELENAVDNSTTDERALRIAGVLKSNIEYLGGWSGFKLTDKALDPEALHNTDKQAFCELVMGDLRRLTGDFRRMCTPRQYERVTEISYEVIKELQAIAYG